MPIRAQLRGLVCLLRLQRQCEFNYYYKEKKMADLDGIIANKDKDYGIGIPRNALNKIWERFYKSDLSRGKDKKGTGLGLAIVKEAIQAHGENINVVSTEGVGTEFIFSLPKAEG